MYETLGWGIVFIISIIIVAYWGTIDEKAVDELQERIEEIQEEETSNNSK